MRKWILFAVAILSLAALVGAACSSGGGGDNGNQAAPAAGTSVTPAPAAGQPEGVSLCEIGESGEENESGESGSAEGAETKIPCLTVDVTDSAITVSAREANAGPLEFIVSNHGSFDQVLQVDGPLSGKSNVINPGSQAVLRANVRAGQYNFSALKDGQQEAGLAAVLVVK